MAYNQSTLQIKLTLRVVIVLSGLHSLADLHADDVNFGFTILQHLLGRLQHLLILIGAEDKTRSKSGQRKPESKHDTKPQKVKHASLKKKGREKFIEATKGLELRSLAYFFYKLCVVLC